MSTLLQKINVIQEVLKITSSNLAPCVRSGEGLDNRPGHNDDEKWPPESNRADTGLLRADWVSRRVKLDKQTP